MSAEEPAKRIARFHPTKDEVSKFRFQNGELDWDHFGIRFTYPVDILGRKWTIARVKNDDESVHVATSCCSDTDLHKFAKLHGRRIAGNRLLSALQGQKRDNAVTFDNIEWGKGWMRMAIQLSCTAFRNRYDGNPANSNFGLDERDVPATDTPDRWTQLKEASKARGLSVQGSE